MSVIKSKRSESDCLFEYNAIKLREFTRDQCIKLPKRRTFFGNTDIAALARDVARYATEANDIYPLNQHEVQMRRDNLIRAKGALKALSTEVTALKDRQLLSESVFIQWNKLIDDERSYLSGAMSKDRERYKNIQKE